MTTNTVTKWEMKSLETTFTTDTIKSCFPDEFSFIRKNNWRFLQNMPEVLVSINENRLSVSTLLAVRRLMDQEAENARLQKENDERTAVMEAETAAKKALYRGGAELTAVGAPWRQ